MKPVRTLLFIFVAAIFFTAAAARAAVTFAVTSSWATGFNGEITITNDGASAVNGWTLEFDFPGTITNLWNGTITSHTGQHYVVANAGYNAAIAVGANVQVGFTADPASALQPPANYIFNGAAAGGGGTNPSITTATLPGVNVGGAYSQALGATGGTAPYSWSVSAGALPAGLTLSGAGVVSGTATATGTVNFTVQVSDSSTTPKTATKALAIAVSATPTIAINNVSVTLTAATGGAGFLSTNGNQIVNSAGNPVRITGINWFGFETANGVLHGLWTRGYKSALDQIKGLGFNTLRIPFSNAMLRAGAATNSLNFAQNPDLQGLTPLQCLDKIVDYCGQIGLRVILDRHSAQADGYLNENVWFISGDAYYTEQRWMDDWVMLATRYAGNATVIGADLFNEPKRTATWGNTAPLTDWNKAAERCGNAILAANPNWLIIVEGVEKVGSDSYWWGGNLAGVAAFPVVLNVPNKLVYSMHDYPASVSAQPWFSAGNYPQNLAGVWDAHFGYLFKNNTAPLLLGEFGSKLATTVDQQWMDKLTDYVDGDLDLNGTNDLAAGKKGMSWTFWCFNPNSGDTGGIVGDDWTTVNQTKLGYIQASMAPMLGGGTGGGAQTATFTVTLSAASAQAVSVAWTTVNGTAVAGTDFTAASGMLNFAAGETSKTIPISLLPNAAPAGTKNFSVQLSSPSGATISVATGSGTLAGSNVPTLSIADASITEGNAGTKTLGFTISLAGTATQVVTVQAATADGTAQSGSDYVAATQTLTFAVGETSKMFDVTINGDTTEEADETFTVTLTSQTGGAIISRPVATGTILNDDIVVHLGVTDVSIYEGDSGTAPVTFTLTLDRPAVQAVSMNVSTQAVTAQSGSDFLDVAQSVNFAIGEQQKIVQVQIVGDTIEEPWETFALDITNASAGLVIDRAPAICTIYDNDGAAHGKPPTGPFNYAEVLQKSLWFYSAQRSGPLPATNRVSWRGDAATTDGSDVGRDLMGGWFDAGDHVKFNFPMAASTTVLAWGGIEYAGAFNETGQSGCLLDELKWVCDYFIKCNVLDANGDTLEFYGQVGNGGTDHAYWGPSETMTMARPAYKVTRTAPGSDLCGETAAALAASSMVFRASNPAYADTLLAHARKLYTFADTYRGKYSDAITDAAAYYNSWSGYQDDLMWGALWLYRATGEAAYLQKAQAIYAVIFAGNPGDQNFPQLKWTHAWDDKTYGCLVLFSMLTTDEAYRTQAERWLDYWTVGRSDGRITYTPGGLAWLDTWGSLRYANNTAFLALVYSDRVRDHAGRYRNFAIAQVNYTLGSNPSARSYVCGFGNNPPTKPHHRGAHGSWNNQILNPTEDRHVLYGALVGGPGNNDAYTDARDNFTTNEVACDYNAAFTGALARIYQLYGGYTLPTFPQTETPDAQFFVEASINSSASNYTEIRALLNNRSAFPARANLALRYRYFVDLTELYAAGGTAANVTVTTNMLDGGTISPLTAWDAANHIYYVELRYDGVSIVPGGSTSYRREAQFRLAIPTSLGTTAWNPANDFSYQGLLAGNQNTTRTTFIPTYEGAVKLEGREPARATAWRQWQAGKFSVSEMADATISAPMADRDDDGLPNFLEYALGTEPKIRNAPPSTAMTGGRLTLTFTRNTNATDTAITVQATDSPAGPWVNLAQSAGGSPVAALVGNVTVNESGTGATRTVVVGDAFLMGDPAHPQRFIRLRASQQ